MEYRQSRSATRGTLLPLLLVLLCLALGLVRAQVRNFMLSCKCTCASTYDVQRVEQQVSFLRKCA